MKRVFRFVRRTPRDIAADIDEEFRFHIDERVSELIAAGRTATEARALALREFGDMEDARRYLHSIDRRIDSSQRRRVHMSDLAHDVKHALRRLRAAPGFTFTAIATLSLGIGANTAIFSVVNGVLLRPLPFSHPEQLVRVWSANRRGDNLHASVSAVDLDDWRAQRRVFADISGYWFQEGASGVDYTGVGEPKRLSAAFIGPGFFTTLETSPEVGRLPREDEMVRGGHDHVVVLSHGSWIRHFGGLPSAINSLLTLDGEPYSVLGVLPASFEYPSGRADVFIPFSTIPDEATPRIRPVRIMDAFARMRAGVTIEQASAEMNTIARRLGQQFPEDAPFNAATLAPLQEVIAGGVRPALLLLLAAVGLLLLITCVNIASLLLARAAAHQREVATRVALGATRGRIMRGLLTESLVLSLMGGFAGVGVAAVSMRILLSLSAGQLPRSSTVKLDAMVTLFAVALSMLTGILSGLAPALRTSNLNLQRTLREGGRGAVGGGYRLRNGLVVAEVALAAVLLASAGLMIKSFTRLVHVDTGFGADHLLAIDFTISGARFAKDESITADYHAIIDQVRRVPGVLSAGAAQFVPFRGLGELTSFRTPFQVLGANEQRPKVFIQRVSDGYFHTLGAPMVAGREFEAIDRADSVPVIVINQALAKRYLSGEEPIGKALVLGNQLFTVIGVVADVRETSVEDPAQPLAYLDNMQSPRVKTTVVARAAGDPLSLARSVREAIWSVDRYQTITEIFTCDDVIGEAVARPRLLTVLLAVFGVLGLALGAFGLYGVLTYLVSQRRQEIGVRMAIGATAGNVILLFVRRGLALTALGLAIGVPTALVLSHAMRATLYDVPPDDPSTFGAVVLAFLLVAILASSLPAVRASRLDASEALRAE